MRPYPNLHGGLFVKVYMLMVALAGGLASAFLVGGEARFAGPSFATPRALVQWLPIDAYLVWGIGALAYAVCLILTLGRPLAIHVLRAGIILYFLLALSFAGSVVVDAKAAASGFTTYFVIATLHLVLQDHLSSRGWERC